MAGCAAVGAGNREEQREFGVIRAPVKIFHAILKERLAIVMFCWVGAIAAAGCAGRHPVAASAPPPIAPTPLPPAGGENTSRPSDAGSRTGTGREGRRAAPGTTEGGSYSEEGNASWYGPPFHGRRASNGEIYDMNKLTAAHRTMAFNTIVRVTNLTNGKSVVVRITDRGPFVENRIIDLSRSAAEAIESIGPGVVPVRLEVVSDNDPFGGYFTVQVGAFKERRNAERLRDRLDALYPPATIQQVALDDGTFYRVRVGRISGEQPAQRFADDLRAKEGFHAMVIRLDGETAGGANQ
jgi:rare lipoprotein A